MTNFQDWWQDEGHDMALKMCRIAYKRGRVDAIQELNDRLEANLRPVKKDDFLMREQAD